MELKEFIDQAKKDIKKCKQSLGILPYNHRARRDSEQLILVLEQALIRLQE